MRRVAYQGYPNMSVKSNALDEVLIDYAKFLQNKDLATGKHRPYLVRRVREFLHDAQEHPGYSFEQTLDLFLEDFASRQGIKPWQIQQASNAIRIYRYQFRGEEDNYGTNSVPRSFDDDEGLLSRLREVIRLRHYAKSTETTYLHWNKSPPRLSHGCKTLAVSIIVILPTHARKINH
jgi:hypothetical protein